ncbi:MAG: phosphoesterase PA-phosphatase related protein [candidate division NC10 bacterium]|nr:phosphoesterase PA-phosphatase related protein [candidate division NC10 bacterium]
MPDLRPLIEHWGYLAICVFVILGNLGIPVPEESILILAGYLVWQGALRLPLVLLVGILSAIAGDNLGYWVGRRYGQAAVVRYGRWVRLTPARLEGTRRFVTRYGGLGVFSARFITGLRFMAGPLAGSTGLAPLAFVTANTLGAMLYVPTMVAAGYGVAYGLGDYLKQFEHVVGRIEQVVLVGAVLGTIAFLGVRALRAARDRRDT